ncbi:DDE-type integrase/transposase/recombinase [Lacticaseibacillus paracasei]|uniref:DDE-type integrase/transposase/recombinase n=1 Tax=Lacticaseibacillus paracasei TaxID=1597 RepID=UPI0034E2EABD
MTYGKDNKQKLRLSAVKDLHNHSVIAWCVAPTETADLVTKATKLAIENNDGIMADTVHSDQGTVAPTTRSWRAKVSRTACHDPGHQVITALWKACGVISRSRDLPFNTAYRN